MTTQTTYGERMAPPMPGVISSSDHNCVTGICETAAPGIGFGLAVSQGTLSDKGTILGGALDTFKGISVRDITLRGDKVTANLDKYQPPNNMNILNRGQIWAEPGEAVNANDPVWFHGTTGVLYKATGSGIVGPILGAKWITSCGVGGRAEVFLSGASNKHVDAT